MIYVAIIGVLLTVMLLDAAAKLSLYRLGLVLLLMAFMVFPVGKKLVQAVSPWKAYSAARTVATAVNPTGPIVIEDPARKLGRKVRAVSCRKFRDYDRPEKSGRFRKWLRLKCEPIAKPDKEHQP